MVASSFEAKPKPREPRCALGQVLITPGAARVLEASGENPTDYIVRHVLGDWGIVCDNDKDANEEALACGARILSAYMTKSDEKIWVITEAKDDSGRREATTILLPEEY